MASEGPEDTIAQQAGDRAWGAVGWDGTGIQTTHTEHSDQQVQEPSISIDPAPDSPGDSASVDEDGGEYDPESVIITTAPTPTPVAERSASAASTRPTKKPKTAGGFIVGSSDDEDDTPVPAPASQSSISLKPVPTEAQARPFNQSPLPQSTTPQAEPSYTPAQASGGPVVAATNSSVEAAAPSRSRLPNDIIGMLEDRIAEDPRGDLDSWLALINEQKQRHKIDDARAVYERFLQVIPQAADIWVEYLKMELSLDNFGSAESIFGRTLLSIHNVRLWTAYLDYVRRRNDLNDPNGQARQTVSQSYDFVLDNIGHDRDAGSLWQDYIQFVRDGPGQLGGGSWQDQQKMDLLRKAYQRAICIPTGIVTMLWKDYNQFELGLNNMTGRKFIQERSPSYITARAANTQLDNIVRGLKRTTLPRLPPAPGFDGDQEYLEQVGLWKSWIAWEKDDPLVLKADDLATYHHRVLYVYKQALMALRFWPEMWVDAAEWCFANNIIGKDAKDTGLQFLIDGVEANPESSLLALKHADRIESTQRTGENEDAKAALAQAVRAPFDTTLGTLYDMIKKLKDKEEATVKKIEEESATENGAYGRDDMDNEDDEGEIREKPSPESVKKNRIKAVKDGFAVQINMLMQPISYLWIALVRVYRRLIGKGKHNPPSGVRGIFAEARQKGRLTADVYIAIAHIEWDIYQDPVATKMFERGAKLFPEDEHCIVEYLKHLHTRRDFTNARVVFSQTVKRFKEKPELIPRLKPLYAYFHGYEARFGELAQVKELEKQMTELFPNEPSVNHFAARFATDGFNPITARVIVSPGQQMRPRTGLIQSVEQQSNSIRSSPQPVFQAERSPRPQFLPVTNSPKRPYQADDADDYNPPRKLPRGASPLKGAAGRRLDQQRRAQHGPGASTYTAPPVAIPRDITFLLGVIPAAEAFDAQRFSAGGMVRLIQNTAIPDYAEFKASRDKQQISRAHTRQASSEYPAFSYPGRNSPVLSSRPLSPYNGGGRGPPPQTSAPYRNSPLRPGSSGSYEPPPAVFQGPGPSQFNPIAQQAATENGGYTGWQGNYGQPSNQNGAPQYGAYY